MLCHGNHTTTCVVTLLCIDKMSLTMSVSTMHFLLEILSILKASKSNFKGSYDKQNLTLIIISYEFYETGRRLVSQISYEMTTCVRSSISNVLNMMTVRKFSPVKNAIFILKL